MIVGIAGSSASAFDVDHWEVFADGADESTVLSALEYEAHYVFQAGLNRARDALGVVRLGGHVEPATGDTSCISM